MFERATNFISKMSKTPLNYWAEFAVDTPLGAVMIFASLHQGKKGPITVLLTVFLGLFLFTIIEYSFHRWLFHGSIPILAKGHRAHHENPLGYDALPFFLPALILLGLAALFSLFITADHSFLLTGTIALSYTAYGLSHFIIHHHRFHWVPARNWAAHHHIHHYHADTNFGVTTPLWDLLLGSGYVYDEKRK
jgi:sterol desaturase/sphingolipid hydroxylase (fatty acid hydroxylase superfamily)